MKKFTVLNVLDCIGMPGQVLGDKSREFKIIATLDNSNLDSITWISAKRAAEFDFNNCNAAIVICNRELNKEFNLKNTTYILVDEPRLAFCRVLRLFENKIKPGIHPTAWVHPEAKLGKDIYIGPFTYVGIAEIGDNSVIHGKVFIYDNVKVGHRVTIHAGTIIGADGFGYQKNEEGWLEKMPHIGGVIIGDDVEVGANTTIDRGTIGNTLIQRFARIDNLVHIAHNVQVGEGSAVIANSMIGGSTIIGKKSWIAPSSSLRDGISIGSNALIGMGSVVTKSVPNEETWLGIPAKRKL